jgi:SAM-dependent methyltransferase
VPGYSEALAYIHNAGFGDLARAAVPVVVDTLRARGIRSGLILDLGCGSGIASREFIRAGFDVLGVDISPAMIRLARRNAPGARFRTGSLLTAALPPCVAVVSLGECINYLFDRGNSQRRRLAFFRRVYGALRPGGAFVFDFAEPGQLPPSGRVQKQVIGSDWVVLIDATEDRRRRTLVRRIVSFRGIGKLYRRTEETHRLVLLSNSELLAELRRMGFRARLTRSYGSFVLRTACAAVLAHKPYIL